MPRIRNLHSQSIDELFHAILSLENVEECYRFFGDLLTVQELSAFAQRFQVASLLSEGFTYEMVRERSPPAVPPLPASTPSCAMAPAGTRWCWIV